MKKSPSPDKILARPMGLTTYKGRVSRGGMGETSSSATTYRTQLLIYLWQGSAWRAARSRVS